MHSAFASARLSWGHLNPPSAINLISDMNDDPISSPISYRWRPLFPDVVACNNEQPNIEHIIAAGIVTKSITKQHGDYVVCLPL